ncbi:hypothetical protein VX037_02055 [Gordonia sp. Z-3]|uniref:Uncharacterized protein n=1 Tax=Gordonia aquimaris TaxID=2984863 RepID=A0A9X3I2J3_9ACTN|nr:MULTISPECIES: hypothetical protein [Gordonia]MAU82001.1 hypothetical protein [Gordonia sp. (in: high G+C Gram-positive bacteria)]MCX2962667.1 hypothetical protein [Gordonia aquimaris]MED5799811.1 hypothetical protein [Gordonia sp. Z-3]
MTSSLPPEMEAAKRKLFDSLDRLHTAAARAHAHADRLELERRERERSERGAHEREQREAQRRAALAQSQLEDEAEQAYRNARRGGWLSSE